MSELETIAIAYDLPEAVCLKSYLEGQGIPTFIDGLHHAHLNWYLAGVLGGLRVRVLQSDADDVRTYLDTFRSDPSDCQSVSNNFWASPIWNGLRLIFIILMFAFLGVPLPPPWARQREWRNEGAADASSGQLLAGLILAVAIAPLIFVAVSIGQKTSKISSPPVSMSQVLRLHVLKFGPTDIGVRREDLEGPVFGLVTDIGSAGGTATLATLADGSTSFYRSRGAAVTGAGEDENVRRMSSNLLKDAQLLYGHGRPVTFFPHPKPGEVIFYFLTFDGVLAYLDTEEDLSDGDDAMSMLFLSVREVAIEADKARRK